MPVLLKIALGKSDSLDIYGNNYDTKDGTGIRDYIHVMDLADAHCEALNFLNRCKENNSSCLIANLGTGSGYSVLELINQFHKSTNIKIPIRPWHTIYYPGKLKEVLMKCVLAPGMLLN